mmetsp:Transcript_19261/g.45372  ORF Transcript_19261/g.45372 Transcript_19261/m.45372 type:complete len:239 (+) Transcript_19261:59-775(+)
MRSLAVESRPVDDDASSALLCAVWGANPDRTPRTFSGSARDLPLADTVMWLKFGPCLSNEGKVRFVQELCRALRLAKGKDYAPCIVWACVRDMKLMDAHSRLLEEDPFLPSRISISDGAYDKLEAPLAERAAIVKGMATSVNDFNKRFKLVPVGIDEPEVHNHRLLRAREALLRADEARGAHALVGRCEPRVAGEPCARWHDALRARGDRAPRVPQRARLCLERDRRGVRLGAELDPN